MVMEGFDVFTERKMNLLVHLAKSDGDFHSSERKLIQEIAEEKGFNPEEFHLLCQANPTIDDTCVVDDKAEMLYLSLKLIQADGEIRDEEIDFCKILATKMNYNSRVIDHFAYKKLPSRIEFDRRLLGWVNSPLNT